jgi:hypothetical protein
LSHSISPFCFHYFLNKVFLYAWAGLDHAHSICASLHGATSPNHWLK